MSKMPNKFWDRVEVPANGSSCWRGNDRMEGDLDCRHPGGNRDRAVRALETTVTAPVVTELDRNDAGRFIARYRDCFPDVLDQWPKEFALPDFPGLVTRLGLTEELAAEYARVRQEQHEATKAACKAKFRDDDDYGIIRNMIAAITLADTEPK